MVNEVLTPPLPAVPPEVVAFAAQQGVTQYLPAVLDLTRRTFVSCPLIVSVGHDAEDDGHRYVALDVEVRGLNVEELLAAQKAWSAGIYSVCPSRFAVHFVLGWQ
jgi:hypothetical protein